MVYLRITDNSTQAKAVLAFLKTMPFVEIINEKTPNKITLKAMEEAENKKLKQYDNVNSLMKDLKK